MTSPSVSSSSVTVHRDWSGHPRLPGRGHVEGGTDAAGDQESLSPLQTQRHLASISGRQPSLPPLSPVAASQGVGDLAIRLGTP